MVPRTKPEPKMILANANIEEIRSRMGADATTDEARQMVTLLEAAGVNDTDDISDAAWSGLVSIAAGATYDLTDYSTGTTIRTLSTGEAVRYMLESSGGTCDGGTGTVSGTPYGHAGTVYAQ